MSLTVVVLAAGQGTRMRSKQPKLLHTIAGKPLLQWVVNAAEKLQPQTIYVVYGHGGELIQPAIFGQPLAWVLQEQQLGTGHAVKQAMSRIHNNDQVLVLCGDTPLINVDTLKTLIANTPEHALGIVTAFFTDPTGLGRILRDEQNNILGIVEEKDASAQQKEITEINTGIMLLPGAKLKHWLATLHNNNAQGEFYLTDVIAMAVNEQLPIIAIHPAINAEVMGVNTRQQLVQLERSYQTMSAEKLLAQGVTIRDPARFDLRGELTCAEDVEIDINVIIEGKVTIGNGSKIGANVILKNVTIGANTEILPNSMLEDSTVGDDCTIGPFARLRPGTQLANKVKVGNFVETKKTIVGEGSKLPHLSYIGDAVIGKHVNVGAGTITCNYDGVNKHQTTIEDGAFIGSNSALVAPVTVEKNATVGAGSVISKTAPAGKLTVARARQTTLEGWQRPKK